MIKKNMDVHSFYFERFQMFGSLCPEPWTFMNCKKWTNVTKLGRIIPNDVILVGNIDDKNTWRQSGYFGKTFFNIPPILRGTFTSLNFFKHTESNASLVCRVTVTYKLTVLLQYLLKTICDANDKWSLVIIRSVAQDELNAADQEKMIGIAILSFISLVTLVFYFFVKNALSVIRVRFTFMALFGAANL